MTTAGVELSINVRVSVIQDLNTTHKEITFWYSVLSFNRDIRLGDESFVNLKPSIVYYAPLHDVLVYSKVNSSTSTGFTYIPPRNTFGEHVIIFDHEFDTLYKTGGYSRFMVNSRESE